MMGQPAIGVYGLGTMGAALALNMAEQGIGVAVANRSAAAVPAFLDRAGGLAALVTATDDLDGLIAALAPPRLLLAMIPSTAPMDDFLDTVLPRLSPGDTVIDAGNANFGETQRRAARLEAAGLHFVGLGVSGGEDGARTGPSMMFGGSAESWSRLAPILTAIAARFGEDPCVARLGPDGAGHFVKTVHNGIEYADMQMLAEVTDLLRAGAGLSAREVAGVFEAWNAGPLESYLVDISAKVLRATDETGAPFVDRIVDSAGQKGTGRWTVIEAVRLGQSATMIEAAVAGRAWSADRDLRRAAEAAFGGDRMPLDLPPAVLEQAVMAARLLEYTQGFGILAAASEAHGWDLPMARIAEIWRAGCIIRARVLDDIALALAEAPPLGRLLMAPRFAQVLAEGEPALRQVVGQAVQAGFAVPVLSAALTYWDTIRQGRGTAALIQGQRDFFGRHGFERVDRAGVQHGPWWE